MYDAHDSGTCSNSSKGDDLKALEVDGEGSQSNPSNSQLITTIATTGSVMVENSRFKRANTIIFINRDEKCIELRLLIYDHR